MNQVSLGWPGVVPVGVVLDHSSLLARIGQREHLAMATRDDCVRSQRNQLVQQRLMVANALRHVLVVSLLGAPPAGCPDVLGSV